MYEKIVIITKLFKRKVAMWGNIKFPEDNIKLQNYFYTINKTISIN